MTITINREPVDFTLDKEETVGDLCSALGAWASSQQLSVVGVLFDGRALDDGVLLQTVQTVEVEVVPQSEGQMAQREVILNFLGLVIQAADAGNQALLDELLSEYGPIAEALARHLGGISEAGVALEGLAGPWGPSVGPHARSLAALVKGLVEDAADPDGALERRLADLEGHLATQGELGALFQRGDDADAFTWILGVFTRWQAVERLVPLALGRRGTSSTDWNQFRGELAPFLRETEAALSAQDYILVTDLLEYEVTPRLAGLRDRLGTTKQP